MSFIYEGRTVTARTPVLSIEKTFLFDVDRDGFLHLVGRGIVKTHGNKLKIHKLQLTVNVAQADTQELERDPSYGLKMTYREHVGQQWYIHQLKHIPTFLKAEFTSVLDSVTV